MVQRYGPKNCIQPYNSENGVIEAIDALINKLWIDETILVWLEQELKALKEHDEQIAKKRIDSLKREMTNVKAKISRVYDAYEDGSYSTEIFESRKKKHENRFKEIEHGLSSISRKDEDISEQIELSLELMQSMQNQWVNLDLFKKAKALGILTKKSL